MATLTTIVVTWTDGAVATYTDITHSARDGWLFIYQNDHQGNPVLKWRFTMFNIRAVGDTIWRPDRIVRYAPEDLDGSVSHEAT